MAINKKLIKYATKARFTADLGNSLIPTTSIVFIQDTGELWTHGIFFGGTFSSVDSNYGTLTLGGNSVNLSLYGHKHNYTDLLGSTTTANQAIVSNGTANGWTLATLGSNAFNSTSYLPLSGGTMTGPLTISTGRDVKIIINNTDTETNYSYISFQQNGTEYGMLGTSSAGLNYNGSPILTNNNYSSYNPLINGAHATKETSIYAPTSQLSVQNVTNTYLIGSPSTTSLSTVYCNPSVFMNGSTLYASNFIGNITGNLTGTASNSSALGGKSLQNILEREYSGTSTSGTSTGWFRIGELLGNSTRGQNCIIEIHRSYNYANTEAYIFSVSVAYNGNISITQLSGIAGTRLITEIRADWSNSGKTYIDLYIASSTTTNQYFWTFLGNGTAYTTWTPNPTLMGTAYEFFTTNGLSSDKGITGSLTGTASLASTISANSSTTTQAYLLGVTASGTTPIYDPGIYITSTSGTLHATAMTASTFTGNLVGTASNADQLDGYHEGSFLRFRGRLSDGANAISGVTTTGWDSRDVNYHEPYGDSLNIQGVSTWYNRLDFGTSGRIHFYQAINPNSTTGCMTYKGTLAYLTDNVASATKLQTARTIWGQSFDGTADITGMLTCDDTVNAAKFKIINSNNCICEAREVTDGGHSYDMWIYANESNAGADYADLYLYTNSKNIILNRDGGKVGILTMTPQYTLDVNGTAHFAGSIYTDSSSLVSNLNADLLDGVHANGLFTDLSNSGDSISVTIGGTNKTLTPAYASNSGLLGGHAYQNILERYYSGTSISGTSTGWFRIAETLTANNSIGISFILFITKQYWYSTSESYSFSITISAPNQVSITQLSGNTGLGDIDKIRIDYITDSSCYVDLHLSTSRTNNRCYWTTIGTCTSYQAWTANPTLLGTAYEFTTVRGCKSDNGFTGTLTGNADTATALTTSAGSSTTPIYFSGGKPVAGSFTWNYSGQSGQPNWLWGSNDGANCYVWNPSNFSVNSAKQLSLNSELTYGINSLQFFWSHDMNTSNSPSANSAPDSSYWYILRMNHGNSAGYYADFAVPVSNQWSAPCYRLICEGSVYRGWDTFVTGGNYTDFSPILNGSHCTNASSFLAPTTFGNQTSTNTYLLGTPSGSSLATEYYNSSVYMNGSSLYATTFIGNLTGNASTSSNVVEGGSLNTTTTVGACKTALLNYFNKFSSGGIGANYSITSQIISNWNNPDSTQVVGSSVYNFIKIGGGYGGTVYGQWLLSSYADEKLYVVGRNNSKWTNIKTLAYTTDTVANATTANGQLFNWSDDGGTKLYLWGTTTNGTSSLVSASKYMPSTGIGSDVTFGNVNLESTKQLTIGSTTLDSSTLSVTNVYATCFYAKCLVGIMSSSTTVSFTQYDKQYFSATSGSQDQNFYLPSSPAEGQWLYIINANPNADDQICNIYGNGHTIRSGNGSVSQIYIRYCGTMAIAIYTNGQWNVGMIQRW